ncbi:MAG: hypothetical protein WAX44_02760 [Minisyncoccia bacterium]
MSRYFIFSFDLLVPVAYFSGLSKKLFSLLVSLFVGSFLDFVFLFVPIGTYSHDSCDLQSKQNLPIPVTSDLSLKSEMGFTFPHCGQTFATPLRKSRIVLCMLLTTS